MSRFIEQCITDVNFNFQALAKAGLDSEDISMLLSFPRSGNGWIRLIIAAYKAVYVECYYESKETNEIDSTSLEPLINLPSASISVRNDRHLALDMYIPDIYLFETVRERLLKEMDISNNFISIRKSPEIFKSHHLVNNTNMFKSVACIVRDPRESIISAALLLEQNLLADSTSVIISKLEEYSNFYIKFLTKYIQLTSDSNFHVIDLSVPEKGLSKWLSKLFNDDELIVRERLLNLIKCMPHKSSFNKEVFNKVTIDDINKMGEAVELYEKVTYLGSL